MKKVKDIFNDIKREADLIAWKAGQKAKRALKWCTDNKEISVILIPIIGGFVMTVIKTVIKDNNIRKETMLKELYVYDRSLGHYHKLRRPLKTSEWMKINERKKNGETLADILYSLNVLD